jgi:hypothetical protein
MSSILDKLRVKKTQSYRFAFEAINTLYQRNTPDFNMYLERDGIKFLKFWWDKVGLDVPEEQRREAKGLAFTKRKLDDGREVILVTLPTPTSEPEAYFLALIPKPLKKNYFMTWKNLTRFISLEYKLDADGKPTTQLGEWTYRFNHFKIEGDCPPALEAFWMTVNAMYKAK